MTEPVRLSKCVAALAACSRLEAEQYIAGGWVRVDGQVVETPQFKVQDQAVTLDPKASLAPLLPMTLLLYKPPGYEWATEGKTALQLLQEGNRWKGDRSGVRLLKRHIREQLCVTPLETAASGLLVFTQEWSIRRKLLEDAALVENEVIVDVKGEVSPGALARLNRAPVVNGRAMLPSKVSINNQTGGITGLRFAMKGSLPGQIAQMCDQVELTIVAMKRIRVGRVPLGQLPVGQWRFLLQNERF